MSISLSVLSKLHSLTPHPQDPSEGKLSIPFTLERESVTDRHLFVSL